LWKIAVIGDTARLRHWKETKFGVFDRATEFCKWLLIGKAHVGVVVPKKQKELRDVLGTLLPHAHRLRRSSASIVVYAPAAYMWTQGLREMRACRLIDFVPDSVSDQDLESFVSSFEDLPKSESAEIFPRGPSLASLHSSSGRLDIKKVAELFDLKVSELARQVGVQAKTALKTPDSAAVHRALIPYEQIANGFKAMGGDVPGFRIWLNSPNSALDGKSPHEVLAEGKANVLAGVVQGALLGQPA
jgi:hypothetical protein